MKTCMFILLFFVSFAIVSPAQPSFQVVVKGKGDPILLFPGFGCTGEVWDEVVSTLAKTHQCHVFTFAGFGNVPPIEMPWLSTIKNQVVEYVKSNRLEKPILLGHSLGGTLSLWLASSEKNMFKKVIAVDALPATAALMIPNYKGEPLAYENPQSSMMLNMDSAAFSAMNTQMVAFMCSDKEKQKKIVQWMNSSDRKTYTYGYIDMLNLDLRHDIANIEIPVTILAASAPDLTVIKKTYQQQYEKLPSVTIHYALNSAHFVMYDQPAWFIEEVTQLVK